MDRRAAHRGGEHIAQGRLDLLPRLVRSGDRRARLRPKLDVPQAGRFSGETVWAGSVSAISPTAWSMRARTEESSVIPAAPALDATCSGREAPTIAPDTFG